jgi:hypothetical protein
MDGPDVKPLWKKRLGLKLADTALRFYPIHYCKIENCIYPKKYRSALVEIDELKSRLESLSIKTKIPLQVEMYDSVRIEANPVEITEDELFHAYESERFARERGYEHLLPKWETVDGLVSIAKENVAKSILDAIKQNEFINTEVVKDSYRPFIVVRGWLDVGRKRT